MQRFYANLPLIEASPELLSVLPKKILKLRHYFREKLNYEKENISEVENFTIIIIKFNYDKIY